MSERLESVNTRARSGGRASTSAGARASLSAGGTPRVSIGLPVYNGERFLAESIQSILAQTFTDLELILCDNASTDSTAEICRSFAAQDSRVRYYRNERNIGAMPNFNRVFRLSRAPYFKWVAHDDAHHPRYLEECVRVLDERPEVVICHAATRVIDAQGREVLTFDQGEDAGLLSHPAGGLVVPRERVYDPADRRLDSPDVAHRFLDVLIRTTWCFDMFGVMRADDLRRSPLHQSFYGSDRVLLADMALRGAFATVPETLFFRRYHAGQSSSKSYEELALWSDPNGNGSVPPQVRCGMWYMRMVADADLGVWDRARSFWAIVQWAMWLGNLIYRERDQKGFLHRLRRAIHRKLHGPGDLAHHAAGQLPALSGASSHASH